MRNKMLSALKDKLSKEDYNFAMNIAMTPLEDLIKEAKNQWRKDDIVEVSKLKEMIKFYDGIYLKYIQKNPKLADYIKELVLDLVKETEQLNDRLYPKSNPDKGLIKWH